MESPVSNISRSHDSQVTFAEVLLARTWRDSVGVSTSTYRYVLSSMYQ